MLKDLLLFIKYPYTAGVIATIWICSAVLMAISHSLDGMRIVIINMIVSVIIALIGFGGKED
jgi:formate/nitrite transporter FocA (FNT family)